MSDRKTLDLEGLQVGDYRLRAVPVAETSDALDTEAHRERARRAEEDRRAAQLGGSVQGGGEAAQEAAVAAVDEAIQEARARLESGEGEEAPILLRDPVTGATLEHR
ncbi:hypothetical protein [Sorangium sp. So ce385]|uniref:hypothetical protein n=1 Tax=Sorangium sp. So ce385 TaxID=3133308 RepID=UPI003F5BF406